LPPEVANLAKHLGVDALSARTNVRLSQTGRMRQDPASPWMAFHAEQTIALDHCGFEWRASTGPGGLIRVRDALVDAQGDLKVTALDIAPIVHLAHSRELTRGELMRYLAELESRVLHRQKRLKLFPHLFNFLKGSRLMLSPPTRSCVGR
jgi:hypothetical protein